MCRHECRMEAGASAKCAHVMCGRDAGVAACEQRSRCVEHGSRAAERAGGSALASYCVRVSSVRLRAVRPIWVSDRVEIYVHGCAMYGVCTCDALTIKNGTKMTSPVAHATIARRRHPLGSRLCLAGRRTPARAGLAPRALAGCAPCAPVNRDWRCLCGARSAESLVALVSGVWGGAEIARLPPLEALADLIIAVQLLACKRKST